MNNDSWSISQQRVEQTLRELAETDDALKGGKLGSWYLVAEYELEEHASLVRLHGTRLVRQTGWRSLGLLAYALESEQRDNFDNREL